MRKLFRVSVELPTGVTAAQMRVYIYDAVASMKGSYHPEDPIFNLDSDSVKVSHLKETKVV